MQALRFERESAERRSDQRAVISIAVKHVVQGQASICQAGDISLRGILLAKVFDELYAGTPRCWVQFNLPGFDADIGARGQVVRQVRHDRFHLLAVRFSAIAPSHCRLIERYIDGPHLANPIPPFRGALQ